MGRWEGIGGCRKEGMKGGREREWERMRERGEGD